MQFGLPVIDKLKRNLPGATVQVRVIRSPTWLASVDRCFQKFPSGRRIIKKLTDQKCCSIRSSGLFQILLLSHLRSGNVFQVSCSFVFVIISTCETAAILDNASPRKPKDAICSRSSAARILLVECREKCILNIVSVQFRSRCQQCAYKKCRLL